MDREQEIYDALQQQWELESGVVSAEEIKRQIALRIARMIDRSPEAFFQLMYRLDIPEQKLLSLMMDEHAPDLIASLIYDRQLAKIASRNQHTRRDGDAGGDDAELYW